MPEDLPLKCQHCKKSIKPLEIYCSSCGERSLSFANYGGGIRSQVFEVVVKQALAGAPWKEICQGPMQVSNITVEEVEEEIRRRNGGDGLAGAPIPRNPKPQPQSGESEIPQDKD